MTPMLSRLAWFALGFLVIAPRAPAADPLRLVPEQADFVFKIEEPRRAAELALAFASMKELEGFRNFRELTESTNFRRFRQLVGYFEKELGLPWPELLEQLAGGGAALAVKFEKNTPPVLVIVQGKNPDLTERFAKLAAQIGEQELARLDQKSKFRRETIQGIEVVHAGDQFHAAVLGSALVYSNVPRGIEAAIKMHLAPESKCVLDKPALVEGRQLLPPKPLAWAWVNFEPAKKQDGVKNVFELPSSFFPFHVVAGGLLDVLWRSPYVAAAVTADSSGAALSIRMPRGLDGLGEVAKAHVPQAGAGLPPPIELPGALFSGGFYLDAHELFWQQRAKLLPKDQLKQVEEFDKISGRFLFGTRLSQLLSYWGTQHRVVVAPQGASPYRTQPEIRLPAFAVVTTARDPEKFARVIEPSARTIGLLTSLNIKMKLVEEAHGDHKILGYQFAEDDKNQAVNGGILFNFSPSYVRVGDQFVFASTRELAARLAEVLKQAPPATAARDDASMRSRFSWRGLGLYLETIRDQLLAGTLLGEGVTLDEAKQQVRLIMDLYDRFGSVEASIHYEPRSYRYDFRVIPGK